MNPMVMVSYIMFWARRGSTMRGSLRLGDQRGSAGLSTMVANGSIMAILARGRLMARGSYLIGKIGSNLMDSGNNRCHI